MAKIVNQYAVVIQEYFQKRVEIWLATVGREIFGIKHHWVRYEFAPGRGQIHAHMLAIPEDHSIFELCHLEVQSEDGPQRRADILSEWALDKFGLTATVTEGFDDIPLDKDKSPVHIRFRDVPKDEKARETDQMQLLRYCQYHQCSGFCMRHPRGKQ